MRKVFAGAVAALIVGTAGQSAGYPLDYDPQEVERIGRRIERKRELRRAEARAAAEPTSEPTSAPAVGPTGGTCWDCVADCESGGDWATNTGNGYYGGLQFLPSTWTRNGGPYWPGFDDEASNEPFPFSREQQIAVASRLPLSAWPVCGAYA
jgi:hypothetical protein